MNLFAEPTGRAPAVEQLHAATAIYTTAHVVDALLDRLHWPESGGRLLDPSAGDGSFMLQALKRLDAGDPRALTRVSGWEIHPGAAASARIKIASHLCRFGWRWPSAALAASQMIVNKDFLTDGPKPGEFQTIAGNPPYLRFQRLPEYFKGVYGGCLPKYARGDLLHAFLDWCSKILPEDGVIGLVCSDRFLFNANAADLRSEIGSRVSITHLARLDAATSFYRPKIRVKGSPPRIHPVEVVLHPLATGRFPITRDAISPDDLERKKESGRTLGDIAKVSIAPWLGPSGIFVVSIDEAKRLRRLSDLIPAVDTDDIDPKTDVLGTPTRYAILTSRDRKPRSAIDHHLQSFIEQMPKRGGKSRPYWVPPETINLDISQPSLLVPRIARQLRAIELPAGVLPINHNLSIVSTGQKSLLELREILLSENSQAWIRRHAPRLENGFYSISTRLLRRLSIEEVK